MTPSFVFSSGVFGCFINFSSSFLTRHIANDTVVNRRTCGASLSSIGLRSQERARLVKLDARIARVERRRVPIAEVAEEVRLDAPGWHFVVFALSCGGCRKELRVDLGVVEAGHRATVQPDGPRSQDEVRAL